MTNKIKDTLNTHKYLLISFFLPLLILEGIAIAEKIQPFGSQSLLIVDALHQYLPFFADYQEKLKQMDSMFYSFHAGLGYNFLGLWAYYLASPLNLVIAFVSKSMLTTVLSHLYMIKIALCCFTAAFYFRKRRGKDEISIVAFGMAYGLCSYMVGYSWNIMWMEVMILLPIILYGVDKLIREHDGRLYCFALFLSLWCNFYMSYMTCLFLILWYLLYEHRNIREFFLNGFRFAGYSLLSAAMASVVLLPAYLGIMQTSSAKLEFPKELWYGTFGNLFSRHFLGTTPLTMSVDDSKINLYCGVLTLLMAGFYLTVSKIRLIDKVRRSLLLVFLFFSFNMPVLGYIWHGFHDQYGIPNRFAFLYIFALIAMAYEGYCALARGVGKASIKISVSAITCAVLIVAAIKTATVKLDMKTVYATVAAIVIYMLCFLLYKNKILRKKVFTTLLCILFMAETVTMAVMGFQENGTVDTDDYFQDTKTITEVKKQYQKNIETRMELMSGRMLDESIWHTLNGMTLFGSTAQGKVVDMMEQLGFYTGVNEYLYEGATPFTNNLFSMKYQIYRPYDTKYTSFTPKESIGNVTVYKNRDKTAIAYAMDDLVKTWDYKDYNPFYVQNDLASTAFGVEQLFHMITTAKPQLTDCKITSDNGDGEYVFKNTSANPDNMVFTIKSARSRELYIHFDGSQVEHTVIEKNGEEVLSGRLDSQIIYLGHVKQGDEIKIRLQLKQDDVMSGVVRLTAAELDQDAMKELAQKMEKNAWNLTSAEGNHLSGTISAKEEKTLFFSIPYDKGWTVKVDGKKVKTKALGEAFLTVKIPKGKHKVSLTYVSPGFKEGLILSIGGFLIFILIMVIFKKNKKISLNKYNLNKASVFIVNDTKRESRNCNKDDRRR